MSGKVLLPTQSARNPYVLAHGRHNPDSRHIWSAINTGIDVLATSRITWTRAGIMWGHSSARPHIDVEALWESILSIVGGGKEAPIMLGCLFRHAMAQRPEKYWLCYTEQTNKVDPITLRPISTTSYWLDKTFVPRAFKHASVADLREKLCAHSLRN